MTKIKAVLLSILVFGLLVPFIYYATIFGKALSYSFLYQDMVRRTVVEMVKPEALR